MTGARRIVRAHPVISFASLSFLFSWAMWLPLVITNSQVEKGAGWPTHLPGLLGPAAAALVTVAAAEGHVGLGAWARRLRPRAAPLWAVGLSGATVALGLGLAWVTHGSLAGDAAYSGAPDRGLVLTFLFVLVINGYGEEAGWRGFLADRLLQRYGLFGSSLRVAALWSLWHVPMFVFMPSFRDLGVAVVGWVVGLYCGSVVLTWLYAATGCSVFAVALWHTAYNFTSATAATNGLPAAVTSTAVMAAAVVLLTRARHREPQAAST